MFTDIIDAVNNGTVEDIRYFVEQERVDINVKGTLNPLCVAAFKGKNEAVEFLISNGANVNILDITGVTPLHSAAIKGNFSIVKVLVFRGANINARSGKNTTPLFETVFNGHTEIAQFLISKGAELNAKVNNGIAALHVAALKGNVEVVKALVSNGANVNIQADNGFTPLHAATGREYIEIIKVLISGKADINVKENNGFTLLDIAKQMKKTLVAKYLSDIASAQHGESSFQIVPGTSLLEKLQWLEINAESNGEYTIIVTNDESIESQTLSFSNKNNITVQLKGECEKIILLVGSGSLFTIESGVTLILENGVTLQGNSENHIALIHINSGGVLVMNVGAVIKGNTALKNGGGVFVEANGSFIMKGGEITGNAASEYGGGVAVLAGEASGSDGNFTMIGGKIFGNTASAGGGLFTFGNFTMKGGEISNNIASKNGGGVAAIFGKFTMEAGIISGNTASKCGGAVTVDGTGFFKMTGGEISNNTAIEVGGGGVHIHVNGTFTMEGGNIFGNNANTYGGGVFGIGNFTKTGGTIYGFENGDCGNKVKVGNNRGQAVAAVNKSSERTSGGFRERTAGPNIMMDSNKVGADGGWDDSVDNESENTNNKSSALDSMINPPQEKSFGDCYIATAVYGSYDAPEVLCLRRFRDEILSISIFGRLFIKLYYRFSPPIAEWLKNVRHINMFVRKILDKMVGKLDEKFNNQSSKRGNSVLPKE